MSEVAQGMSTFAGIGAAVFQFIPGGQAFAAALTAVSAGWGAIADLTAEPPRPPAQLQEAMFGADQAIPYALGRCEVFGHLVHHEAHGRDREGVPNPWYTQTIALTHAGPVVAIDTLYANKNPISFGADGFATAYYGKYLRGDTQIGATPESAALDWTALDSGSPPSFGQWSSSHKLSGIAAMQFGMLLDSEETHYRSGPPKFSAVGRWTRHYDPRQDGTYPGGAGTQRSDDEATYGYSVNGVVQALTYALGRYQNGFLVLGGGLPIESIDVASFVAAANVADANGWTCNGVVYENGEDGEIWNNLKLMLQTAAAWPTNDGGVLRCLQRRPLVTLDTITSDDLEGPVNVKGMRDWADGKNTIIPTIVSEANEWAEVPITPVSVPTLVTAQGEERPLSRTYKLVTDPDQAGQLAVLDIYDTVEIDPIVVTVGRRFIGYDVGDAFLTDIPEVGLSGKTVVMLSKTIDPMTGRVTMGLKTDEPTKHAFALDQTNTAPPQPALVSNEDLDFSAFRDQSASGRSAAVNASHIADLATPIRSAESSGSFTVTVPAHTRVYGNPRIFGEVSVDELTLTGLAVGQIHYLYYDDPEMTGGSVTLAATTLAVDSSTSDANPYRHHVGYVRTPQLGQTSFNGESAPPPTTIPPRVPTSDNADLFANTSMAEIQADIAQAEADAVSDAASDATTQIAAARTQIETASAAARALLEGEIDVVDTKADGVVQRLAGVSIRNNDGTFSSVTYEGFANDVSGRLFVAFESDADAQSLIASLQTVTANSASDITTLRTDTDDNTTEISTVKQTADGVAARIDSISSKNADGTFSNLTIEQVGNDYSSRLFDNRAETEGAKTSIASLQTVTANSATDIDALEALASDGTKGFDALDTRASLTDARSVTNAAGIQAAQSAIELYAGEDAGSVSRNPTFSAWPSANAMPDDWILDPGNSAGVTATRIAGTGRNTLRLTTAGSAAYSAAYQLTDAGTAGPGWYVVEGVVNLPGGSWTGGGFGVFPRTATDGGASLVGANYIRFETDADDDGTVGGATGQAGINRAFSALIDYSGAQSDLSRFRLYLFAHFSTLNGGVNPSTQQTLETSTLRIRRATAQEIEQGKALAETGSTVTQRAATLFNIKGFTEANYGVTLSSLSGGVKALAGFAIRTAAGGVTAVSDFVIFANRITLASGTALFQLLTDRVLTNVPLGIELGDNALYLFPNASILLWYGDKTIALASMTNANGILSMDSSGDGTITYQGASLTTEGSVTAIQAPLVTGVGAASLTTKTAPFITRGNTMQALLTFTGKGSGSQNYLTKPNPSPAGEAVYGEVDLYLEYRINGGAWQLPASALNRTGTRVTSLSEGDSAGEFIGVSTVDWLETLTATHDASPGDTVEWQVQVGGLTNLSGALIKTSLTVAVTDT